MDLPRRRLPSALLTELRVAKAESHGVKGFRLADIATLPDEALLGMVPARGTEVRVFVQEGFVYAGDRSGEMVRLFPAEQASLDVFNMFNGDRDLRTIAELVAGMWGVEFEDALLFVRTMFLSLLKLGVLVPANPLAG